MPDESVVLGELAEEYTTRLRAGQLPDIEDYARRHPELAGRIRELFPALMFLEGMAGAAPRPGVTGRPELAPAPVPGRDFGNYRIEREIARGGMGIVYEAVHRALEKRVALKVLPVLGGGHPVQLERFLREARTAAALHHGNIVSVFDVGQVEGTPYYAMQYIEGRGLDRVLRQLQSGAETAALPEAARTDFCRWVARLGVQAAEGLAYAHQRGVIHRDVKPSNLLLDDQGTLWITDFGLARRLDDPTLTQGGALLGTPRYMSPEQAEAWRRPVDWRTDLYSLGATLYELLTRRPAVDGRTPQEVVTQILGREPPPPRRLNPAVPRDLETVVLKALAKQPEDRYATAADMADDLRHFLEKRPIQARRRTPVQRAARWARRHRTALVASAAVLMVVVLGLGVSIARVRQQRLLAEAAALEAHRHRVEAEAQRRQAEVNFRRARAAVDQMLTQVGEQKLDRAPRQELLRQALRYYEKLARQDKVAPYDAARALARCIALVEADISLPAEKRKTLAREYGDRAVKQLRSAIQKGYRDLEQLKRDPVLNPLRPREDFKQLLAELKKAAAKPRPSK
jgi:hypothetical protein